MTVSPVTESQFKADFERKVLEFLSNQKRLLTISKRSLIYSLPDFPLVTANFPFNLLDFLLARLRSFSLLKALPRDSQILLSRFTSRRPRLSHLCPPYRTLSAKCKLNAFRTTVIQPLQDKYPDYLRRIDQGTLDTNLLKAVSKWEKIPNYVEAILNLPFYLLGITYLGLDPKSLIPLCRDKQFYRKWCEYNADGLIDQISLKIKFIFDVVVPWMFTFKFLLFGLTSYILWMIIVEWTFTKFCYRRRIQENLVQEITNSRLNED
jgi:hypothetical protein